MPISPKKMAIRHIALHCTDITVTKKFYENMPGFTPALVRPEIIAFLAGPVIVSFKKADGQTGKDVFIPFNTGIDHLELACETVEELHRVAEKLTDAGVENTGVQLDEALQKIYVAFKGPDHIQWQFYMN